MGEVVRHGKSTDQNYSLTSVRHPVHLVLLFLCAKLLPSQESASSHTRILRDEEDGNGGVFKNMRLPMFVVDIAYADGIEELATYSKGTCADLSDLVVFHPSETEFHTRLEVCFATSAFKRRNIASIPSQEVNLHSTKKACTNSLFFDNSR